MQSNKFDVRELLAAMVLTVFIIALSIPASSRAHARSYSSQLRGIHKGLVTYAN